MTRKVRNNISPNDILRELSRHLNLMSVQPNFSSHQVPEVLLRNMFMNLVQMTNLLGFLLELFDGSLVDTTAFVDEMTGGGRLSRVYVADHHDVNVSLFLRHLVFINCSATN